MKKMNLLVTLIIMSSSAFGYKNTDFKGYDNPKDAINAFINPLKQGSKGLPDSLKAANNLNGETMDYVNSSLKDSPKFGKNDDLANILKNDIKDSGKLEKAVEKDSYSRLNGNMQTFEYELKYSGGKKRTLSITVIKTSVDGGYEIMRISPED